MISGAFFFFFLFFYSVNVPTGGSLMGRRGLRLTAPNEKPALPDRQRRHSGERHLERGMGDGAPERRLSRTSRLT